jgi:hypothetical protein
MASVYPTATRTDQGVRLAFPYDPEMVDGLKAIPAHARTYSPETKVWAVREPYVEQVVNLLLKHFPHATVVGERARQSAPPPPPPKAPTVGPHAALFLLPSAPPEVVDAAYRALVKIHHPDRLPEPEKATGNATLARINVAYQALTVGRRAS